MHVFPSAHQLYYVRSLIVPISGETGLRIFERDAVENAVQKLVDTAYASRPSYIEILGRRYHIRPTGRTVSNSIGYCRSGWQGLESV